MEGIDNPILIGFAFHGFNKDESKEQSQIMKRKNGSGLKTFLTLWVTQSFSALGSTKTSYALVIWSYTQEGYALATALLMVCS